MAVAEQPLTDRLTPILGEVARAVTRRGISEGTGGKASLRIEIEEDVRRLIHA